MGEHEERQARSRGHVSSRSHSAAVAPGKLTNPQPSSGGAAPASQPSGTNGMYASPGGQWKGGFQTGDDFKDQGAVCDREGTIPSGSLCFLSETQRNGYVLEINRHVSIAVTSYQTALGNARVGLLLEKAPGLGFAAELMIGVAGLAAGGLIGLAAGAVARQVVAQAAWRDAISTSSVEAINAEIDAHGPKLKKIVDTAIKNASATVKTKFQGNTAENARRAAFLEHLQNAAAPMYNSLAKDALAHGDDAILMMLANMLDPETLTVALFTSQIDNLLSRFEGQQLDHIGSLTEVGAAAGTMEVVRVQAFGKSRLAVMKLGERRKLGTSQGEVWNSNPQDSFMNWVDDDFAGFAQAAQTGAHGGLKTIDVTMGGDLGSEIAAWRRQVVEKRTP